MLPVVRLVRGRARPFWHGNPVVFSGAIESVQGSPAAGDAVEVRDHDDRVIGWGFFNPASSYRVRIVRLAREATLPEDPPGLVLARVRAAANLRQSLGLPGPGIDAWRLLNSEGDGLSGVTVDVYGPVAVVQVSARWAQVHRTLIEAALREVQGPEEVVFRSVASVRREEGLEPDPPVAPGAPVEVMEHGIRYALDPRQGQKTGFYLDQRDNRDLVRTLASGRRVLDAYCFTGGFALNAAAGGATEVLGVDSSGPAIQAARRNAEANGRVVEFREGDALAAMEASPGEWDLVVCDPPKLAAGRAELEAAFPRYLRVNRAAIAAVRPGGILVTCSCSGAVRRDPFLDLLRDAAALAGRTLTVTHVRGAAPDHPVHPAWPEGEYLKCVVGFVR